MKLNIQRLMVFSFPSFFNDAVTWLFLTYSVIYYRAASANAPGLEITRKIAINTPPSPHHRWIPTY
jgi:hypothetical protein